MTVTPTGTANADARSDEVAWYAQEPDAVIATLGVEAGRGLSSAEVASRQQKYGPNQIASEPSPSTWAVALIQIKDPMNLMLIVVAVVSLFVHQVSVEHPGRVPGDPQRGPRHPAGDAGQGERRRAGEDADPAGEGDQGRHAGRSYPPPSWCQATWCNVEAGDLVPADGRLLRSATLETQEASLTGESAPIPKDPPTLDGPGRRARRPHEHGVPEHPVTRGTATLVVTETGMHTQMGRIATMLSAVKQTKSPLQRELNSLTGVLGPDRLGGGGDHRHPRPGPRPVADRGAAAGHRDGGLGDPHRPADVRAGDARLRRQAARRVEGGGEEPHRRRDPRRDQRDQLRQDRHADQERDDGASLYYQGDWFMVEGDGYAQDRQHPARRRQADARTSPGSPTGSAWTATPRCPTTAPWSAIPPRRPSWCWPPSWGWMPRRPGAPTRAGRGAVRLRLQVHGDVPRDPAGRTDPPHRAGQGRSGRRAEAVLDRADPDGPVPLADKLRDIEEANRELSEQGLRVLAFAVRLLDGQRAAVLADPMALVADLALVGHGRHHRPAARRRRRRPCAARRVPASRSA